MKHFYNAGFGWICRACETQLKSAAEENASHSRLLREGESESKAPRFSNPALAKWTDASRTTLLCPRCGIEEKISTTETL